MVSLPDRPAPPDEASTLGATLLSLRRERGLTLDALAAASGVSRAMISKIERGAAVPTATILGRLAGGLKVGLSRLLGATSGGQAREPVLLPATEQPVFTDVAGGLERRSASPVFPDRFVDLALNRLSPGGRVAFPPHHAGVEEYLHVIEGTLDVLVDDARFTVPAGATLFYPGDRPHAYENPTAGTVVFLVVIDGYGAR